MSEEEINEILELMEGAANMMRGMMFDPAIPNSAKEAMQLKIKEIDEITEKHAY